MKNGGGLVKKDVREIITRKEAKALGIKMYFTGKLCKRGHISDRYTSIGRCVECVRANQTVYYEQNKTKILKSRKEHTAELSDVYIRGIIRRYGLTNDKITPEMIKVFREYFTLHRLLKVTKKEIKNKGRNPSRKFS